MCYALHNFAPLPSPSPLPRLSLTSPPPLSLPQVCYALHNFAAACAEEADNDSNVLSPFIPVLLEKLLATSTRRDCDEDNVRAAAYEAVNMMVSNRCALIDPK